MKSSRQLRQGEPAARSAHPLALASGRNVQIEPSACRYALRPSKISCA
jgi:hypothetical protein